MTDFRTLCAELVDCLEKANWPLRHKTVFGICLDDARAALAQPEPQGPSDEELKAAYWEAFKGAAPCGADESWLAGLRAVACWNRPVIAPDGPAVPDGREPASVTDQPTDKELLELMPETMRDEFSYAAKVCSDATGGQVKPGIFRLCLNHSALDYARAVLARWGNR